MGLPFDLFYPVGVFGLAVSGSDVFVGGRFTNAGGMAAANIAKWNGSAWSALGQGLNESVTALAVSGSEVYAGGSFTMAGGVPANCVAKWNGSAWSALGSGMAGGNYTGTRVSALVATGTNLYAAGEFTTAGGIPANHIAQWDGSSWRSLGSGMLYI
jgi:uncharacterized circularly permuted ATP-grasp superfamily protein